MLEKYAVAFFNWSFACTLKKKITNLQRGLQFRLRVFAFTRQDGFPKRYQSRSKRARYQYTRVFSVFISHVIKTKNRNRSINKFKNLGYDR